MYAKNLFKKGDKMKRVPYYLALIQLIALIVLIINHASRDLFWQPLLIILVPSLSLFLSEATKWHRR